MKYALCYRITFRDGGDPIVDALHIGTTQQECERAQELLPAIAYSGSRPVLRAESFIAEITDEQAAEFLAERFESKTMGAM